MKKLFYGHPYRDKKPKCSPDNIMFVDSTVLIEIDNAITKTIKTPFIGVNWFNWFDTSYCCKRIFKTRNQSELLAQICNEMGTKILRFPSGYYASAANFPELDKETFAAACKEWKTRIGGDIPYGNGDSTCADNFVSIYEFFEFLSNNNLKGVIQFNLQTYYDINSQRIEYIRNKQTDTINWDAVEHNAQAAANLVQYAIDNDYYDLIDYWEMGNEDYLCYNNYLSGFTGKDYGDIAAIFYEKLKVIAPDIKIALTTVPEYDFAYCKTFVNGMLTESNMATYKNNPNVYYVKHSYWTAPKEIADDIDLYSAFYFNNPANDGVDDRVALIQSYGVIDPQVVVNEMRAGSFRYNDTYPAKYGHSWTTALAAAKFLNGVIYHPNTISSNVHNLLNMYVYYNVCVETSYWSILNYSFRDDVPFIKHPDAYVFELYNNYVLEKLLTCTSSTPDVSVLSSSNDNNLNIIITNVNKSRNIQVNLNGFESKQVVESKSMGYELDRLAIQCPTNKYPQNINIFNLNITNESTLGDKVLLSLPANSIGILSLTNRIIL